VGTNHTNLLANLASCNGNQVSVIDVVALKEAKLIPVGAGAVSIASSTDGTKVYTANAHDGNISIIKTSTDSEILRMPAPHQNLSCSNPSSCPSNVTQTPFMVVTFP
jgi:YVTN family beta-propeller protein